MIYSGVTIVLGLVFPHLEYRYLKDYYLSIILCTRRFYRSPSLPFGRHYLIGPRSNSQTLGLFDSFAPMSRVNNNRPTREKRGVRDECRVASEKQFDLTGAIGENRDEFH
jgi:hypothetical protein